MPNTKTGTVISISITRDLFEKLKAAVPHYGGRSRIICLLIKGYLEGRFQIQSFK